MKARPGLAESAQRPSEHPRAQVRAADADIDDIGYREAATALEGASLSLIDEAAHLITGGAHRGHHVAAFRKCPAV